VFRAVQIVLMNKTTRKRRRKERRGRENINWGKEQKDQCASILTNSIFDQLHLPLGPLRVHLGITYLVEIEIFFC